MKRGNKKGSTLIEFLIYMVFFSFIIMVTMHSLIGLWQRCLNYEKKRTSLINLAVAHDLLVQDLKMAPSIKKEWKVCTPTMLIWHQEAQKDIGWVEEKGALMRIEGIYIPEKQTWKKCTKNLVVSSLKKIEFKSQEGEDIVSITFTLTDAYYSMHNEIILLKRSLPWKKEADPQLL